MTQTYKTQFPEHYNVPERLVGMFEMCGFKDTSYGNDVAPSWEKQVLLPSTDDAEDGMVIRVWVDHEDPSRREVEGARFVFGLAGAELVGDEGWLTVYECEAMEDAVAFVTQRVVIGLE